MNEEWTLIYDGDCEFCRRQVRWVERRDTRRRIRAVPFQSAELSRLGVSRAAAEEAMQLVSPEGTVWSGAAAAREVLRLLPRWRAASFTFGLPGAMAVAERVYGWVARRRHRLGCGSEACQRGGGGIR
jgi:predicted DCC family thiol-disulfide oxidoreductase YuxK